MAGSLGSATVIGVGLALAVLDDSVGGPDGGEGGGRLRVLEAGPLPTLHPEATGSLFGKLPLLFPLRHRGAGGAVMAMELGRRGGRAYVRAHVAAESATAGEAAEAYATLVLLHTKQTKEQPNQEKQEEKMSAEGVGRDVFGSVKAFLILILSRRQAFLHQKITQLHMNQREELWEAFRERERERQGKGLSKWLFL